MLARWGRPSARRFYMQASRPALRASAAMASQPSAQDDPRSNSQGPAKLCFSAKPRSLSLPPVSKLRVMDIEQKGLKGFTLKLLGYYHWESKLRRGADRLHQRVTQHVDNPALYEAFGLEKSFRTTHAMLVLHIWMCLVRLRSEGKDGADFGQYFYEIYNQDLEKRVVAAGVKMLFSRWMKELEKVFYGSVIAYDKAMQPEASKDDLPKTLWRNIFAEDDSLIPSGELAIPVQNLARYVRQKVASLALTDTESLLSGNLLFSEDVESNTE